MAWDRLKRLFGGKGKHASSIPTVSWIEAADNPWGVRLLDVRPLTLTMTSLTTDLRCATNAVSFGQVDGRGFIGEEPTSKRVVEASLLFPIDRMLADGVLYIPREMEHKWAIFYHRGEIICVRSWLRQVQIVARVVHRHDLIEITQVGGRFGDIGERPEFTIRTLDYLLRSHALNADYPVPLPPGMESNPKNAAMWCMSMFGNRALFAAPVSPHRADPELPLRTHSLLHIAVARGNVSEIEDHLSAGVPIDLLDADGLAPLHWALACNDSSMMGLLLNKGSPVDVRSAEGATPLMTAVQGGSIEKVSLLLQQGADVDARDLRGFTSLHRAAEMGKLDFVKLLLESGAAPNPEAAGFTPRSCAERGNHADIVAILDKYIGAGG